MKISRLKNQRDWRVLLKFDLNCVIKSKSFTPLLGTTTQFKFSGDTVTIDMNKDIKKNLLDSASIIEKSPFDQNCHVIFKCVAKDDSLIISGYANISELGYLDNFGMYPEIYSWIGRNAKYHCDSALIMYNHNPTITALQHICVRHVTGVPGKDPKFSTNCTSKDFIDMFIGHIKSKTPDFIPDILYTTIPTWVSDEFSLFG